ncbi:hypothetical protein SUGI_0904960 [Cryptomeria japonica]|nr:hypothetical protein SUGI_0904960 [Cryptomeria japonica]
MRLRQCKRNDSGLDHSVLKRSVFSYYEEGPSLMKNEATFRRNQIPFTKVASDENSVNLAPDPNNCGAAVPPIMRRDPKPCFDGLKKSVKATGCVFDYQGWVRK